LIRSHKARSQVIARIHDVPFPGGRRDAFVMSCGHLIREVRNPPGGFICLRCSEIRVLNEQVHAGSAEDAIRTNLDRVQASFEFAEDLAAAIALERRPGEKAELLRVRQDDGVLESIWGLYKAGLELDEIHIRTGLPRRNLVYYIAQARDKFSTPEILKRYASSKEPAAEDQDPPRGHGEREVNVQSGDP
jgi:hypothetical protein